MIERSVHLFRLGKLRLLLIATACTVFGTGCTPDLADGTAATFAGDLVRQLLSWWLL